jgi:hypothetical protein
VLPRLQNFSKSHGQISRQADGSPQINLEHHVKAPRRRDAMNGCEILPFVCRFDEARTSKSKQTTPQCQQRGRIGKCKSMNESAIIRNFQQQLGSPLGSSTDNRTVGGSRKVAPGD